MGILTPVLISPGTTWGDGGMEERRGGMTVRINCAVLLLQFTHSSRPIQASPMNQHRGLLNPLLSSHLYPSGSVPHMCNNDINFAKKKSASLSSATHPICVVTSLFCFGNPDFLSIHWSLIKVKLNMFSHKRCIASPENSDE